mgnify:CR=1 FL=1
MEPYNASKQTDSPNKFLSAPCALQNNLSSIPSLESFDPRLLNSQSIQEFLPPDFFSLFGHFKTPKIIGTCTPEERKTKVQKFLEKRKRRKFTKSISYECRKRVADSRLRIKGRFVKKEQAEALKGLQNQKNNVNL